MLQESSGGSVRTVSSICPSLAEFEESDDICLRRRQRYCESLDTCQQPADPMYEESVQNKLRVLCEECKGVAA